MPLALPDLVVYDEEGQPETVQYHKLSVLLLNELQRQKRLLGSLQAQIDARQRQIQELLARNEALE